MIKRIFRKRLRGDIVSYIGASHPDFERVFNWIYKAPTWDWKVMFFCIEQTAEHQGFRTVVHLDKAEDLLRFLCKD